jgi:BarA-like signal transduction histidine kinase
MACLPSILTYWGREAAIDPLSLAQFITWQLLTTSQGVVLIVAVRQIPPAVKDMMSMKVCFSSRSNVTQSTVASVPPV